MKSAKHVADTGRLPLTIAHRMSLSFLVAGSSSGGDLGLADAAPADGFSHLTGPPSHAHSCKIVELVLFCSTSYQ